MAFPSVRLFCSDLDGTLIGHATSCAAFKAAWESLPPERRPLLVYSSGRLVEDLSWFVVDGVLPAAEYYIGGVGTQIFSAVERKFLEDYERYISSGWNRARVVQVVQEATTALLQNEVYQSPLKASWHWFDAAAPELMDLSERLRSSGVEAQLVYSSGRDLDVIPAKANKAGALRWLCEYLHITQTEVLVAGDTGNDAAMFQLSAVRGIVVGNAQPELRLTVQSERVYSAKCSYAQGVLEGLAHFGVR